MTINPDDLHDPVVQVFAGEAINLDVFEASGGPDRMAQARNVVADPCAAAECFYFLIHMMLQDLFQVGGFEL